MLDLCGKIELILCQNERSVPCNLIALLIYRGLLVWCLIVALSLLYQCLTHKNISFLFLPRISKSSKLFSGPLHVNLPQNGFSSDLSSSHSGTSLSFKINRSWKTRTALMPVNGETLPHVNGFPIEDEFNLDSPTEGFNSIPEAIEDIRQGKVVSLFYKCYAFCVRRYFLRTYFTTKALRGQQLEWCSRAKPIKS